MKDRKNFIAFCEVILTKLSVKSCMQCFEINLNKDLELAAVEVMSIVLATK